MHLSLAPTNVCLSAFSRPLRVMRCSYNPYRSTRLGDWLWPTACRPFRLPSAGFWRRPPALRLGTRVQGIRGLGTKDGERPMSRVLDNMRKKDLCGYLTVEKHQPASKQDRQLFRVAMQVPIDIWQVHCELSLFPSRLVHLESCHPLLSRGGFNAGLRPSAWCLLVRAKIATAAFFIRLEFARWASAVLLLGSYEYTPVD